MSKQKKNSFKLFQTKGFKLKLTNYKTLNSDETTLFDQNISS